MRPLRGQRSYGVRLALFRLLRLRLLRLVEGEGEYPPGFDIEAVLRNGKVYLSFKETTGCVCGGSGACVMRGGSVNKTMPPAMAAGLLGASGSLCAGCMDTWRRQACYGMGLRRVPDFGVKASRP